MTNIRLLQEVRGVLTRFEPLTEDALAAAGAEFTLHELAQTLDQWGLSLQHVVHDPTRMYFSTYYADYESGLYGEIYLQRSTLSGDAPIFKQVDALGGSIPDELVNQEWRSYYIKCVPLPLLLYDFQRRYRDIPDEEVFSVWHGIYKRIDFSNGMWSSEVLDYVFDRAPVPTLPPLEADGRITIYRGMGTLSATPEQAISWSTHPGNALWFAIHTGRGTRLTTARILPEQIVAYFPSYQKENEVIVRPGTVLEYRDEDMIPAVEERFIPMLADVLPEYIQFGRQAQKLGYEEEVLFQLHGLKHILRVLLLTLLYIRKSGDPLTDVERQILIYFSLLHDIGRDNDERDESHGDNSVRIIHTRRLRINGLTMPKKGYRVAELLIQQHCRDDSAGEAAILAAPGLTRRERERTIHLYHICKDMDGLDRVRFNGLDYRMLRTQFGKQLPLIAGALLEENVIQALQMSLES